MHQRATKELPLPKKSNQATHSAGVLHDTGWELLLQIDISYYSYQNSQYLIIISPHLVTTHAVTTHKLHRPTRVGGIQTVVIGHNLLPLCVSKHLRTLFFHQCMLKTHNNYTVHCKIFKLYTVSYLLEGDIQIVN